MTFLQGVLPRQGVILSAGVAAFATLEPKDPYSYITAYPSV